MGEGWGVARRSGWWLDTEAAVGLEALVGKWGVPAGLLIALDASLSAEYEATGSRVIMRDPECGIDSTLPLT